MEGPARTTKRTLLRREERAAQLLRGAAAAFAASGFAATSMDDVAAACGVSRLLVYRHFATKEDLYRAILQRVFDRQAEELVAGLQHGARPGLGMRTLLTVARENPDGFVLLWRHAAREPQFAEYARQQRALAVDAVVGLLGLASGDPVLDRWTAESLYAWLLESVLTWLDVGDPARDEEVIERATAAFAGLRQAMPATSRGH